MNVVAHLKRLDWALVITALLLVGFGLVSIYSSSLSQGDFFNLKKQIVFLGIGFFLMLIVSFLDWRGFRDNSFLILAFYLLCLFGLLGLYFFAPEIRGVKGWYKLGIISFDPIEFTKIVLIILLAKYFSMRHIEMYRIRHILLSGFYVLLPSLLIFFQPDLGSVLILLILWIGILLVSGIKLKHFFILCFCGLLILVSGWSRLLNGYQKDRIASFLQPQVEPLETSWSQNQARIAIGSGGIFGKGIGKGSQTQYGFLPEPKTDFIFSSLAEETGLVGAGILLILFFILLERIIRVTIFCRDNFSRLFVSGFAILLIIQLFINVGMNLGILPVIGITLPFVSYGGSSLIACFLSLGILQSIIAHRG